METLDMYDNPALQGFVWVTRHIFLDRMMNSIGDQSYPIGLDYEGQEYRR